MSTFLTEQPTPPKSRRSLREVLTRSALVLGIGVTVLGLVSAVLVALALRTSETRESKRTFDTSTALLSLQLTSEVGRYVDATTSLAASLGSHETLTFDDFHSVTEPLSAALVNGIESVSYVVETDDANTSSVQTAWRNRGAPYLTLQPWENSDAHYFPIFTRSLHSDIVSTPQKVDLARYPEVVTALQEAKRTDQVTISRGLADHKDNPMFAQDQQPTFVLVAPAYFTDAAKTQRAFRGWVAIGLRAQDLANRAFAKSDVRSFDNVRVTGLYANNEPVLVSTLHTTQPANTVKSRRSIVIAQDLWTVEVVAAKSQPFFEGSRPELSGLVLAVGTVGSILFGALVYVLASGRSRALDLVASRTADLQRDIERRERVERDLTAAQAESDSQKADLAAFAGFAAHDLKAPLTVLVGYLELIKSGMRDPATVKEGELPEFAERAIKASQRMRALVDSLLAFARVREAPLAPKSVELEPSIRTVVDELLEQRKAEVEGAQPVVTLHPPFAAVQVDPDMMHQVLENLIGNALKYVEPGAVPTIDIKAKPTGDGMVQIEVSDHGIGIPSDRREAVFGGFVRAHGRGYSGSGLGLAICKRVVERHGGTITVEENPGGGTRFLVHLPEAAVTPG